MRLLRAQVQPRRGAKARAHLPTELREEVWTAPSRLNCRKSVDTAAVKLVLK